MYDDRFADKHAFWRMVIRKIVYRFLDCGDLRHGFPRIRCVQSEYSRFSPLRHQASVSLPGLRLLTGTEFTLQSIPGIRRRAMIGWFMMEFWQIDS